MKTIDLTYAGETVTLADLPEYAKFYRKLTSGAWEPRTFAVLGRVLTPEVTYVDIGAWIGVTPFWAAKRAKRVIAVEPDPKCRKVLEKLTYSRQQVTLLEGALSPEKSLKINAVDCFGSSETSALSIGNGQSEIVRGLTIADIMREAGPGPCFVKIDIEGYEYEIAGEIATLARYDLVGVQLAVHPQLYEKTLKGPKFWRRFQVLRATRKLTRLFPNMHNEVPVGRFPSLAAYLWQGVWLRPEPKGADLVFLKR
jgi:FkbM family methyltransferase